MEGRYYEALADELLAGARAALEAAGATVDVITVPGALEIPIAAEIALEAAEEEDEPYEAVVALGCVIRGETYHFEIVAGESSRGLMDLALAHALPLGNGILTVETERRPGSGRGWARATRRRCRRSRFEPGAPEAPGPQMSDQVSKPMRKSAARLAAVQALYQMTSPARR